MSRILVSITLFLALGCGEVTSTAPDASNATADSGSSPTDATSTPADADTRVPMLDQQNLTSNGNLVCNSQQNVGQTFQVGSGGLLAGIEIAAIRCQATENDIIRLGIGRQGGATVGTVELSGQGIPGPGLCGVIPDPLGQNVIGPAHIDVRSLGFEVTSGERYQFTLECPSIVDFRVGTSADVYPMGENLANGNLVANSDLAFKIFVAR